MAGFPDLPEQLRNSGYRARLWNRSSGGWASISTARRDLHLINLIHYALEDRSSFCRAMPHYRGALISFFSSGSGWRSACILPCVGDRQKENDNGANNNLRDCLAESGATSTSATLGADQAHFRNCSLCGPRICFYLRRFVLDRDVELGNHCWRSRRLALPRFQFTEPAITE